MPVFDVSLRECSDIGVAFDMMLLPTVVCKQSSLVLKIRFPPYGSVQERSRYIFGATISTTERAQNYKVGLSSQEEQMCYNCSFLAQTLHRWFSLRVDFEETLRN